MSMWFMISASYDPVAQLARAEEWLAEADHVNLQALRELCLIEAAVCRRRAELSLTTPVLRSGLLHAVSSEHLVRDCLQGSWAWRPNNRLDYAFYTEVSF
jgi:hypothetical protein